MITALSPGWGVPGDLVVIQGEGFSPTLQENSITINGVGATLVYGGATGLAFVVPNTATTGPLVVTTLGQTSAPVAFSILPKILAENSTGNNTLLPNQTAQGQLNQVAEQDRYAFMALAGDVITLKLNAVPDKSLPLQLALEDAHGIIVAHDLVRTDVPEIYRFKAEVTGVYKAVVFAQNPTQQGHYKLNLQIANPTTAVGQVNITAGDSQTASINSEFSEPIEIYVTGPTGKPLAGVPVTFTAEHFNLSAGQGFSFANAGSAVITTNSNGIALVKLSAPSSAGEYDIQVNVPGLTPQTLKVSVIKKQIAQIQASEQAPNCGGEGCAVGKALETPYTVTVLDSEGKGIPDVFVKWAVLSGDGTLNPGNAKLLKTLKTDANGQVSVTHTLGKKLYVEKNGETTTIKIPQSVIAVVSSSNTPIPLVFTPLLKADAPAKVTSLKNNYIRQTYGTGTVNAIKLRVTDQYGNPVEKASLSASAPQGIQIMPGEDLYSKWVKTGIEQFTQFKPKNLSYPPENPNIGI